MSSNVVGKYRRDGGSDTTGIATKWILRMFNCRLDNVQSLFINSLMIVTLSHCELTNINFIANCPNVRHLDLSSNHIGSISKCITDLISLQSLSLENNRLHSLKDIEYISGDRNHRLKKLSCIRFKGNPMCNDKRYRFHVLGLLLIARRIDRSGSVLDCVGGQSILVLDGIIISDEERWMIHCWHYKQRLLHNQVMDDELPLQLHSPHDPGHQGIGQSLLISSRNSKDDLLTSTGKHPTDSLEAIYNGNARDKRADPLWKQLQDIQSTHQNHQQLSASGVPSKPHDDSNMNSLSRSASPVVVIPSIPIPLDSNTNTNTDVNNTAVHSRRGSLLGTAPAHTTTAYYQSVAHRANVHNRKHYYRLMNIAPLFDCVSLFGHEQVGQKNQTRGTSGAGINGKEAAVDSKRMLLSTGITLNAIETCLDVQDRLIHTLYTATSSATRIQRLFRHYQYKIQFTLNFRRSILKLQSCFRARRDRLRWFNELVALASEHRMNIFQLDPVSDEPVLYIEPEPTLPSLQDDCMHDPSTQHHAGHTICIKFRYRKRRRLRQLLHRSLLGYVCRRRFMLLLLRKRNVRSVVIIGAPSHVEFITSALEYLIANNTHLSQWNERFLHDRLALEVALQAQHHDSDDESDDQNKPSSKIDDEVTRQMDRNGFVQVNELSRHGYIRCRQQSTTHQQIHHLEYDFAHSSHSTCSGPVRTLISFHHHHHEPIQTITAVDDNHTPLATDISTASLTVPVTNGQPAVDQENCPVADTAAVASNHQSFSRHCVSSLLRDPQSVQTRVSPHHHIHAARYYMHTGRRLWSRNCDVKPSFSVLNRMKTVHSNKNNSKADDQFTAVGDAGATTPSTVDDQSEIIDEKTALKHCGSKGELRLTKRMQRAVDDYNFYVPYDTSLTAARHTGNSQVEDMRTPVSEEARRSFYLKLQMYEAQRARGLQNPTHSRQRTSTALSASATAPVSRRVTGLGFADDEEVVETQAEDDTDHCSRGQSSVEQVRLRLLKPRGLFYLDNQRYFRSSNCRVKCIDPEVTSTEPDAEFHSQLRKPLLAQSVNGTKLSPGNEHDDVMLHHKIHKTLSIQVRDTVFMPAHIKRPVSGSGNMDKNTSLFVLQLYDHVDVKFLYYIVQLLTRLDRYVSITKRIFPRLRLFGLPVTRATHLWDYYVIQSCASHVIQRTFRGYRCRKQLFRKTGVHNQKDFISRLLENRAVICLQRFIRLRQGIRKRSWLLRTIRDAVRGIHPDNPVIYMDCWVYFLLLRYCQQQHKFVDHGSTPASGFQLPHLSSFVRQNWPEFQGYPFINSRGNGALFAHESTSRDIDTANHINSHPHIEPTRQQSGIYPVTHPVNKSTQKRFIGPFSCRIPVQYSHNDRSKSQPSKESTANEPLKPKVLAVNDAAIVATVNPAVPSAPHHMHTSSSATGVRARGRTMSNISFSDNDLEMSKHESQPFIMEHQQLEDDEDEEDEEVDVEELEGLLNLEDDSKFEGASPPNGRTHLMSGQSLPLSSQSHSRSVGGLTVGAASVRTVLDESSILTPPMIPIPSTAHVTPVATARPDDTENTNHGHGRLNTIMGGMQRKSSRTLTGTSSRPSTFNNAHSVSRTDRNNSMLRNQPTGRQSSALIGSDRNHSRHTSPAPIRPSHSVPGSPKHQQHQPEQIPCKLFDLLTQQVQVMSLDIFQPQSSSITIGGNILSHRHTLDAHSTSHPSSMGNSKVASRTVSPTRQFMKSIPEGTKNNKHNVNAGAIRVIQLKFKSYTEARIRLGLIVLATFDSIQTRAVVPMTDANIQMRVNDCALAINANKRPLYVKPKPLGYLEIDKDMVNSADAHGKIDSATLRNTILSRSNNEFKSLMSRPLSASGGIPRTARAMTMAMAAFSRPISAVNSTVTSPRSVRPGSGNDNGTRPLNAATTNNDNDEDEPTVLNDVSIEPYILLQPISTYPQSIIDACIQYAKPSSDNSDVEDSSNRNIKIQSLQMTGSVATPIEKTSTASRELQLFSIFCHILSIPVEELVELYDLLRKYLVPWTAVDGGDAHLSREPSAALIAERLQCIACSLCLQSSGTYCKAHAADFQSRSSSDISVSHQQHRGTVSSAGAMFRIKDITDVLPPSQMTMNMVMNDDLDGDSRWNIDNPADGRDEEISEVKAALIAELHAKAQQENAVKAADRNARLNHRMSVDAAQRRSTNTVHVHAPSDQLSISKLAMESPLLYQDFQKLQSRQSMSATNGGNGLYVKKPMKPPPLAGANDRPSSAEPVAVASSPAPAMSMSATINALKSPTKPNKIIEPSMIVRMRNSLLLWCSQLEKSSFDIRPSSSGGNKRNKSCYKITLSEALVLICFKAYEFNPANIDRMQRSGTFDNPVYTYGASDDPIENLAATMSLEKLEVLHHYKLEKKLIELRQQQAEKRLMLHRGAAIGAGLGPMPAPQSPGPLQVVIEGKSDVEASNSLQSVSSSGILLPKESTVATVEALIAMSQQAVLLVPPPGTSPDIDNNQDPGLIPVLSFNGFSHSADTNGRPQSILKQLWETKQKQLRDKNTQDKLDLRHEVQLTRDLDQQRKLEAKMLVKANEENGLQAAAEQREIRHKIAKLSVYTQEIDNAIKLETRDVEFEEKQEQMKQKRDAEREQRNHAKRLHQVGLDGANLLAQLARKELSQSLKQKLSGVGPRPSTGVNMATDEHEQGKRTKQSNRPTSATGLARVSKATATVRLGSQMMLDVADDSQFNDSLAMDSRVPAAEPQLYVQMPAKPRVPSHRISVHLRGPTSTKHSVGMSRMETDVEDSQSQVLFDLHYSKSLDVGSKATGLPQYSSSTVPTIPHVQLLPMSPRPDDMDDGEKAIQNNAVNRGKATINKYFSKQMSMSAAAMSSANAVASSANEFRKKSTELQVLNAADYQSIKDKPLSALVSPLADLMTPYDD